MHLNIFLDFGYYARCAAKQLLSFYVQSIKVLTFCFDIYIEKYYIHIFSKFHNNRKQENYNITFYIS